MLLLIFEFILGKYWIANIIIKYMQLNKTSLVSKGKSLETPVELIFGNPATNIFEGL
jgi:hypothetical protein